MRQTRFEPLSTRCIASWPLAQRPRLERPSERPQIGCSTGPRWPRGHSVNTGGNGHAMSEPSLCGCSGMRSEERRVGKEVRYWVAAGEYKRREKVQERE